MNLVRKIKITPEVALFVILLLILFADRWIILYSFAFKYVDGDQLIFWEGCRELLKDYVHEPCFYGQSYNVMIESLFAAPLFALGIPLNIALPGITSILTLIPFILFSAICLRQNKRMNAYIILCLPVLFRIEYGMITSIPRGFITGVFFASVAVAVLKTGNNKWNHLTGGFFSVFAFVINPNSIILSFPYYVYQLLKNFKHKTFYVFETLGAIPAVLISYSIQHFYSIHPTYVFHIQWKPEFSWKIMVQCLSNLDIYFNYFAPILWKTGSIVLVIIVFCAVLFLKKKQYHEFWATVAGFLFLMFSLGINKNIDGTESVFFPYGRMYVAIPLLICVFISWINIKINNRIYYFIPIMLAVIFLCTKIFKIKDSIIENTSPNINHVVDISTLGKLDSLCSKLRMFSDMTHASLLIFKSDNLSNYGCPVLFQNFPLTLMPSNERRTWRLLQEDTMIHNDILFFDEKNSNWETMKSKLPNISGNPSVYWLHDNKLTTLEVLKKYRIHARVY